MPTTVVPTLHEEREGWGTRLGKSFLHPYDDLKQQIVERELERRFTGVYGRVSHALGRCVVHR